MGVDARHDEFVLGAIASFHFAAEGRLQIRLGQHLVGRPVGDDHSLQQHHPIAAPSLLQVMRRHDHEMPGCALSLDHLEDGGLARQVQAGDRLIEQQAVVLGCEHHRHHDTLTLAARQLAERPMAQVRNVKAFGRSADRLLVAATQPLEQSAAAVSADGQYLLHGHRHIGMCVVVLAHETHADVARRLHPTRCRGQEPAEHPQQGGLAAPVRAHECDRRRAVELQVAGFKHVTGPERDTDVVEMEQGVPHFDFEGGWVLRPR